MNSIKNTTEFDNLAQENKPVLLDFYADWCGPCQTLLPTVEKLSKEFEGNVEIRKVNVDENRELAIRFGIRSIPALFFLKGNDVVEKVVGAVSEGELRRRLNSLMSA